MRQIQYAFICFCLAFVLVEPRVQLHRGLPSKVDIESINEPYPYIFPQAARGRAAPRHPSFEQLDAEAKEHDENLAEYYDEQDEEDVHYQDLEEMSPVKKLPVEHRGTNELALPKKHSGGILVPDGIIEVQGETIYDEKTGEATLVVPMQALEAIPNGSIVALLENDSKSSDKTEEDEAEERANRVYVRRRNTGSRIKVRAGTKKPSKKNKRVSSAQKKPQRRRRPQTQIWDLSNMNAQSLRRRPSSNGKQRPVANNKRRNNNKSNRRSSTKQRRPTVVRDYFSEDY